MSEVAVNQTILSKVAEIVAAHTEYPLAVQTDNYSVIDQALQTDPYLLVLIDYLAADQADMADVPLAKQWGQLQLTAVVKEGTGRVAGATLRDFVRPYFSIKSFGGVHFQVAELHKGQVIKGWEYLPILVNFFYHAPNA